ncbi:MAG TPA: hypothetical protein VNQ77_18065 [Frankiaceae bacterium]|nr:hypothetical protein [Frankiaceae bacterium]
MIAKIAAFVGGVILAPAIVTGLFRVFDAAWPVLPVTIAIVVVGVLKGGLLRWFALGFGAGVVGFEALLVFALDNLDSAEGGWLS